MIRFPQKHIADNVAERILNVQQQMQLQQKQALGVEAQGQRLDQALQQPIGDVAPIEGMDEAFAMKAMNI